MKRFIIIISSILIITSALYIVYLNRPELLEQEEISVYTEIVEDNCIPVDEVVENSKIEEIPNTVVDIVDNTNLKADNTVKKETTIATKKQESNINKETPEVKEEQKQVNQFTLTEQRVINKIRLKYGTISIYSQDYYFNGEYITTQCFII